MTLATESELAALYIMASEAVYIRIVLEEMGNKQPPNPLQTDNVMEGAVCNNKIQPKLTKAMEMLFHWLRDIECQNNLEYIGDHENPTTWTTGLSTIQKHTTETQDGNY